MAGFSTTCPIRVTVSDQFVLGRLPQEPLLDAPLACQVPSQTFQPCPIPSFWVGHTSRQFFHNVCNVWPIRRKVITTGYYGSVLGTLVVVQFVLVAKLGSSLVFSSRCANNFGILQTKLLDDDLRVPWVCLVHEALIISPAGDPI